MAKKKSGIVKAAVGIGAVVVAGKVAYEKYKTTKSRYTKEEQDSADLEVRKYNAICEKKVVEVEDEEFVGCEIKSVASNTTLDLGLAVFENMYTLILKVYAVMSQSFFQRVLMWRVT